MCRFSVWTVTLLVLVGLAALARADDADDAAKQSWRPLGWKTAPPAKPKAEPPKTEPAPKRPLTKLDRQAREKADWLRRVAVCDKLREIALATNDQALLRKADDLDRRAWDLYQHGANPASAIAAAESRRLLERRLGTSSETGLSLLPEGGPATAGQASIREVRP